MSSFPEPDSQTFEDHDEEINDETNLLISDLPPFGTVLAGSTHADNWAHFVARSALLNFLVNDKNARDDETVWQCLTRFVRAIKAQALPAFERSISNVTADRDDTPAGKRSRIESIESYTNWFYLNRICKESIRSIAHCLPNGNDDKRSHVRYGIR